MTNRKEVDPEVKKFLRDQLEGKGVDHLSPCVQARTQILEKSANVLDRKYVRKEANEYAYELACTKIIWGEGFWEEFLSDLRINRVSIRDVDAINKRIKTEEEIIIQEMLEMMNQGSNVHIIENVKEYRIDFTGNQLKITVLS